MMNTTMQKSAPTYSTLSAVLYSIITFLLLPVTILGYILWVGGAIFAGRGSGVSGTAQGPLSARFFEHNFGVRQDEAANKLMLALPNVPPLGLKLFLWPMMVGHRLTGYVPRAFQYPFQGEIPPQYQAAARMSFFDQVVERYIGQVDQFVILGAGFDTRAFRLPATAKVRSFEVDMPKTQAVKRDILAKAGIDTSGIDTGGVTFAPADFETDDWLAKLIEAGFDVSKPTLFIWEGVIIYLEREAVESSLRKIASTPKGSMVAFDYMTTEPLEGKDWYWRYARAGTKAAGEPFKFGIDSIPPVQERIAELLAACGLTLKENQTLGDESGGKRAWGGFAVAVVK
jgi:methyltransferase (TIGR00027 family)